MSGERCNFPLTSKRKNNNSTYKSTRVTFMIVPLSVWVITRTDFLIRKSDCSTRRSRTFTAAALYIRSAGALLLPVSMNFWHDFVVYIAI